MKIKEIREKNAKELQVKLTALREKLRELNFKLASKQQKNVREVRVVKKDIATIMMVLEEKNKQQ